MQAAVYRRFGAPEVVAIEEVDRPAIGPEDILIRTKASTVSIADHRMRARDLPRGLGFLGPISLGAFRPKHPVLGMDVAGVVDRVGERVTRFRPGDEVIAMRGSSFGGHAEYVAMPQHRAVAHKPTTLDFEQSVALVFGGLTAIEFLEVADLQPGDEVLVNGASGAVGSAAVQLAKAAGARVTAVTSAGNRDLVESLGADEVIDYGAADFAASGRRWRVIMDCVGNAPFSRVEPVLERGGILLLVVTDLRSMLTARRISKRTGSRVVTSAPGNGAVYLERLARLADEGRVVPVIDRTYPLSEVVDAHRYVDTGRKRGNVVLQIG